MKIYKVIKYITDGCTYGYDWDLKYFLEKEKAEDYIIELIGSKDEYGMPIEESDLGIREITVE